jgi:hypothetical protein
LVALITPPNFPVGVVFSWALSWKNEVNATKMNKTKGLKKAKHIPFLGRVMVS